MGNNIGGYQHRSSLPFVSTWCLHHSFASQTSLSDLHPNLIYPSINSSPIEPIFGVSDWTREPILPGETPPPTPPLHALPAALTPPEPPIRLKRGLTDKPNHAPSFTSPTPSFGSPIACLFWQHGYAWSLHHLQPPLYAPTPENARRYGEASRLAQPLTSLFKD